MADHNSRRGSYYTTSDAGSHGDSYSHKGARDGNGEPRHAGRREEDEHENDYPGRYGQDRRHSGHDYERDFNPSTYGNQGSTYRGGSYEGGYGNRGYGGAHKGRSSDAFNRGDYGGSTRHERLYSYGGSTREHQDDRDERWQERDPYSDFQNPYQSSTRVGEGQHRGKGPKGYRRSDERILEDVNDRLADDPYIDAREIEISIQNGDITMTGTIHDRQIKRRAEDIVESVSGVRNVENRLRVHHDDEHSNIVK